MTLSTHEQVLASMREMAATFAAAGIALELPPPSSQTLGTTFTEFDLGKFLAARFAFAQRFANPLGMFQGGFLAAAFDEVFGPLAYMTAGKPVVAIEISTTYIRPFTAADELLDVRAEVVVKNRSLLVLRAEAKTAAGKLIATSQNHGLILSDDRLKIRQ